MYRVLIVDDEEPVLDSYEFMLKGDTNFVLSGKARSGFEALKLIYEIEPDLVFMDINIPGLDGLEVIADVHKKFPSIIFVLSTAYERFDLAQRAIPLGVFAYLVKPVSKKTFLSTLDTVRETLQARADPAVEPETETLLQNFMRRTIWKAMSESEWETCRKELALPSDKGIVFLLETGNVEKYCPLLAARLSYKHHCVYDALLNRGLFLVSGETGRDELEELLNGAIAEILPENTGCFKGIGDLRRGPELYLSCGASLRDLENRRKRAGGEGNRERQRLVQLRRKIGIADNGEVKELFSIIWHEIFALCEFNLARAKMIPVFMFLMDEISGCYSQYEDGHIPEIISRISADIAAEIMALKDIAAWESWSAAAFEKLLKEAALRRAGSFPLPLVRAISHIQEHYSDPQLQLGSAAEAAQVSPAYLSRLFSDHLKTSFIDYLTEYRVEQGEKLIRESNLNIKETAFAVGYQDPNYFSKIFRKLRGLSPSEFAERAEK